MLKRRKGLIIGVTTCMALAMGGGGAWAASTYLGDGEDPQSRLPASTAAFATFNLDVSHDQQMKLLDLVAKFPESGVGSDIPTEAVAQFLETLEAGSEDFADGAFSTWVGPAASIAMWEHKDAPYVLATVPSIDDSAAESGLTTLRNANGSGQVGFALKDGYATIAFGEKDAQDAAEAAVGEAEDSPLSDSERYASASEFLGEDQVVTAWADLEQSHDMLDKGLPGHIGGSLPFDGLRNLPENLMKGQVAFGAKAQDFGIEGVSRTFGAQNVPEGKDGLIDELSKVPESDIAGALAVPDDVKDSVVLVVLNELLGMNTDLDHAFLDKLFDLLSGTSTTAGVSGVTGSNPTGQGSVDTKSPLTAEAVKALIDLSGPALDTSVDGGVITASTPGYGDKPELGETRYYPDAVGGAAENLNGALYFDIQNLLPAEAKQPLRALKAVGLTLGNDNGESVGNYRLIIG